MTIREYRRRRWPAWLALVATLLLAFAPPLSQLLAARAMPASGEAVAAHHHHRDGAGERSPASHGSGEDCLRACGYCDFLAHTPLLHLGVPALPAALPAFAAVPTPLEVPTAAAPRYGVAQARGPPRLS